MAAKGWLLVDVVMILDRQVIEFDDTPIGAARIPFLRCGITFDIEFDCLPERVYRAVVEEGLAQPHIA